MSGSFERAVSKKRRRGDRSNVMSAVSTWARHVSAASLVITTSHRETRVYAFIVPSSSFTRSVVMTTAELHPGKRCVCWEKEDYWGQWSLHVPLSLTHIHTQAFPQHAVRLRTSTCQYVNLLFDVDGAGHLCFCCSFN